MKIKKTELTQTEIEGIKRIEEIECSLNLLESPDIIKNAETEGTIKMLKDEKRNKKEELVLSRHVSKTGKPYKITPCRYTMRGKPIEKWVTASPWKGKTAKIMKNSYDEVIEELYAYYFDNNANMTLQEAFDAWLKDRKEKGKVSTLTLAHNSADWNRYMKGICSHKDSTISDTVTWKRCPLLDRLISTIKVSDLVDFYECLTGDGSRMKRQCFMNVRGLINGAFSYAFKHEINCIDAERIPYDDLLFKEEEDNSENVYTPEEREKVLHYLESLPKQNCYTLAVRLAFTLCIRIGELRALTWNDIDTAPSGKPFVWIRHQIVDKNDGSVHRKATDVDYMKSRSKAGKRKFPLSDYAILVLGELHKLHPESKYICTNNGGANSIYTNKFNEHLKQYCEAAGVPYRSSHKIRFYAVSQMYDMGLPEKDIMALAGHSNVTTTRHYNRRLKEVSMSESQLSDGFGRC